MSICHSVIVICCILVVAVDGFRHGLAPRSGHRSQVTALSAANNNGFGVQKVAQKVATALIAAVCSTGVIDPSWAAVEYLKQPTSDFKDEEKTVAEFKKAQQKIRNEWDAVIARLESSNDPLTTETALKDLKGILTKYNFGIPTGAQFFAPFVAPSSPLSSPSPSPPLLALISPRHFSI